MAPFDKTTSGKEVVSAFQNEVRGKTFIITGPSAGGLGAQTAIFLAQAQPEEIILLGRGESKATSVIDEIKSSSPSTSVKFFQIDLDSFSSIRSAAYAVNKYVKKIDVLINNAGIMYVKDFTLTAEGIEAQLSSNHIGHFLLTNLLLQKILAASPGARIVNLTSNAHVVSPMRFDDYHFNNGKKYDPWVAYGQSKTANILFTTALAAKLASKGVLAFAVHPGIITTNLASHIEYSEFQRLVKMYEDNGAPTSGFDRDVAQGTSSTIFAALSPSLEKQSGAYVSDCAIEKTPEYAHDDKLAEQLWTLSESLVGETFTV